MPDIKKMFEICRYVIANNAKIADVCEEFKMVRKTAQMYTGKYLRDYVELTGDETAKQLLERIQEIKKCNEKENQIQSVDIDLNEVIEYIISSKSSVEHAALTFGISESLLHKYISKIKESDQDLYKKLREVQVEVSKRGNTLGGKTSIRGPKYTDFESVEIAQTMIDEGLTIREASDKFNVPKSTTYERVKAVKYDEIQDSLQEMFDSRKRKK